MGIEALLERLVVAIEDNTAAHRSLADVAKAAAAERTGTKAVETKPDTDGKGSKADKAPKAETSDEDEDDAAAKKAKAAADKKAKAAAEKKAAAEAAKKAAAAKAKADEDEDDDEDEDEDDELDLSTDEDDDDALPEVKATATMDELKTAAAHYLDEDRETFRDQNKKNVIAAFKHLGVSKLGGLVGDDKDEDRAKLLAYIAYWEKGLKVDFEAVDERVAEAA